MKQSHLIPEISDLFLQFSSEVKERGKLKLYDINVISEDVLIPILNIIFDTDLKNLNSNQSNFPGIDLASNDHLILANENNKIAFQITSTNTITKVKKTLKQYTDKEFYKSFDKLYIYNLIEKQTTYSKKSQEEITKIIDGKFDFDITKNVIDKVI